MNGDKLFVAGLLGLVVFLVAVLSYATYRKITEVCIDKTSKVIAVGGCNRYGECSAMLENGRKSITTLPVVGEEITYRKCE